MKNLNYYPLKRVKDKLGEEEVRQMLATPTVKKGRCYLFANGEEWLKVETNHHHSITSVVFTPHYRSSGLSLKRAQTKQMKICRYPSVTK